jgi:hypothetical protein
MESCDLEVIDTEPVADDAWKLIEAS